MARVTAASGRKPTSDPYAPAPPAGAWAEYAAANPATATDRDFAVFIAGYRRGFGQGALLATSTIVHAPREENDAG